MFNTRESENMESHQNQRQKIPNAAKLASYEKKVPQQFPPLTLETRTHVTTEHCAFLLSRKSQTLRAWACLENGPLRPMRINGRLAWPVAELKLLLLGAA